MGDDDLVQLNIVRTGSSWTAEKAYWAGQSENKSCMLCGHPNETSDHFGECSALKQARQLADKQIAMLNQEKLPKSIRHGVAPAMAANMHQNYWVQPHDDCELPLIRGHRSIDDCEAFCGQKLR